MKIGILTFHWATNYGAVLQCYALQTFLEEHGHTVEVVDYKPKQSDDSLYTFLRYRKFLHLRTYLDNRKKEKALILFRSEKIRKTKRLYSNVEIPELLDGFDAIISGSDQVLNPSFLMHGEGRNIVNPAYFLGFQFKGLKIGYALSFGCVTYPKKEREIASKYFCDFDYISVREKSGLSISASLGREDAIVVPDPTLLKSSLFYHQLADECQKNNEEIYVYSFFIRHITERKSLINSIYSNSKVIWNNDDGDYTMQGWLSKISAASFVVTDSFHCMVMCLKFHKPFAVITELKGNVGMNDRLYTLLSKMSLESLIIHKTDSKQLLNISDDMFDWDKVDRVLDEYYLLGKRFLERVLL